MFLISKESIPKREEKIQAFWMERAIFKKSTDERKNRPLFSIYDGPPFATGLPHYGHLLAGTIKDVLPRFKTMKGYYIPRRFGWDCHGLPVENEIEKAKALSGASSIETFGIASFNEECRKIVLRYTEEWKKTVNRMGRWVDFDNIYRTMDLSYMESVWWVFGELWKKGLVYRGYKVMPFSAKLGTPLSNFEANLNYKEVNDPSVTVIFPSRDEPKTAFLAWTTTPWTLVSNLALTVNPELDYVKIHDHERDLDLILVKSRLKVLYKEEKDYEILSTFKGSRLEGMRYEPPFGYFLNEENPKVHTVLTDDFVGDEDGTGIVHTAPAFGEQDFFVCHREGIEPVCPVDQNGKFTHEIPEYEGQFVKDADKDLIRRLKEKGRLFASQQIRHRYPFCWRSDTPLIYKAVSTWFVSVEKIKERLLAANDQIRWVPDHLQKGRFGKWLENARDWAISRNRYWGTPIPIWMNEDGETLIISSKDELEKRTGQVIDDLHRHYIDDLGIEVEGKIYRRIPEVFDCWFESGSMPYAQNHYPFENVEFTKDAFPADFIAEGLDQTRGWFYTLTILAVALFDQPAFKNVIVNGIILAEDGAKMSKRLKNYPDPEVVLDKYGADAIRLYLLNSGAVYAEDLRFSEKGVELVLRQFLIPLWNSFVFLSTYAEIYSWRPKGAEKRVPKAEIDRWILSRLQGLIEEVDQAMAEYRLAKAVEPFVAFIDQLTNWYIRRSRSRFWADEDTPDRREAFETLYEVLVTLSKVAAPFIPFMSEEIYQELKQESDPESVHLCDFPSPNEDLHDCDLEDEMEAVQAAVSIGHALRKEHHLKVRQPLPKAHLISADPKTLGFLNMHKKLIAEELNVKEIDYHADEEEFVHYVIKPNFRVLGKKVGPLMSHVKAAIETLDHVALHALMKGQTIDLAIEDQNIPITPEEVEIERKAKEGIVASSTGGITIALDTTLDDALLLEGLAREVVNKINTMRRNESFEVTDRIKITIAPTERLKECFSVHREYICGEVLGVEVNFATNKGTEWDLNGEKTTILLKQLRI